MWCRHKYARYKTSKYYIILYIFIYIVVHVFLSIFFLFFGGLVDCLPRFDSIRFVSFRCLIEHISAGKNIFAFIFVSFALWLHFNILMLYGSLFMHWKFNLGKFHFSESMFLDLRSLKEACIGYEGCVTPTEWLIVYWEMDNGSDGS